MSHQAGLLLGADDLQKDTSTEERALLRFLDHADMEPEDAIVRLAESRAAERAREGSAP